MKPIHLCGECHSAAGWGDRYCTNCGTLIDWPEEVNSTSAESTSFEGGTKCSQCGAGNPADATYCRSCGEQLGEVARARLDVAKDKSRRAQKTAEPAGSLFSWKIIAGFVGFVIVAVIVIDQFSGPRTVTPQQPAQTQAPAADMQAMGEIAELERRVTANPNDMQLTLQLANLAYDHRFFDKAIQYYKKYLAEDPKNTNARVDLGTSYFESGDLEEARKEMETALKYDPKHLQAHYNLGVVNLSAGNLEEANKWFKKTVALAPESEIGRRAKQILEQHSSPLIQQKQ